MGVRILEGTYDGTEAAAAMVDSASGSVFGPLFESGEEIEEFCAWLRREPYLLAAEQMGLLPHEIPNPTRASAADPRVWPDAGLAKLIAYWTKTVKTAEAPAEA